MTLSNLYAKAVSQEAIAYAMENLDGGFFFSQFEKEVVMDLENIITKYLVNYPEPIIQRFVRQYLAPLKAIETNGLAKIEGGILKDQAVQIRTDTLDAMRQEKERQYITFLMLLSAKETLDETQPMAV